MPDTSVSTHYFNPVAQDALANSAVHFLLSQDSIRLDETDRFPGAGVYLLYYDGDFPAYKQLSELNSDYESRLPIYVGKADPKGTRHGGLFETKSAPAIFNRVSQHSEKILTTDLSLNDFYFKYVVLDFVWIKLVETTLISRYRPVWNSKINGFGNKVVGSGRSNQKKSRWDVIHPGTGWRSELRDAPYDRDKLRNDAANWIAEVANELDLKS